MPAIFLNGALVGGGDGMLEDITSASDIRAVEIYARNASIPIQFETRNGCGSIVIWTGPRASPQRRR